MTVKFLSEEEKNKPADVFLHFFNDHPEDFDVAKGEINPVYEEIVIVHKNNVSATVRRGSDGGKAVFLIANKDSLSPTVRQISTGSSDTAEKLWDKAVAALRFAAAMRQHRKNEEASKILMDTYGETL